VMGGGAVLGWGGGGGAEKGNQQVHTSAQGHARSKVRMVGKKTPHGHLKGTECRLGTKSSMMAPKSGAKCNKKTSGAGSRTVWFCSGMEKQETVRCCRRRSNKSERKRRKKVRVGRAAVSAVPRLFTGWSKEGGGGGWSATRSNWDPGT